MLEPQNEHFVRDLLLFSLCSQKNRRFPTGFLWTSKFAISHATKSHACDGICTLPPLGAALALRFAENTQHETSEVLRLPCEMTMEVSKMLRLPRKLQFIFWNRRKNITPATCWNVTKCHACHAKRGYMMFETKCLKPPKVTTFAELPIGTAIRTSRGDSQTVASDCATSTRPQPPSPKVKRELLLRIREKNMCDDSDDAPSIVTMQLRTFATQQSSSFFRPIWQQKFFSSVEVFPNFGGHTWVISVVGRYLKNREDSETKIQHN